MKVFVTFVAVGLCVSCAHGPAVTAERNTMSTHAEEDHVTGAVYGRHDLQVSRRAREVRIGAAAGAGSQVAGHGDLGKAEGLGGSR